MPGRIVVVAAAISTAVAGVGAVQLLPGAAPEARAAGLVGYESCAALLEHYRDELGRSVTAYGWPGTASPEALSARQSADAAAITSSAVGAGATGTNVQEQGVDEPDLVKLRDGRLVVLTGTRLRILSAQPQPRQLGALDLGGTRGYGGGELLLVGDRVLVILAGWRHTPAPSSQTSDSAMSRLPGQPTTRVALVDLDGNDPRLLEQATYDARYVSARLVDGTVRLVTTTSPQLAFPEPTARGISQQQSLKHNRRAARSVQLADVLPQVVRRDADGSVLEQGHAVDCDDTSYAPGSRGAATLLVSTFRPGDGGLEATDRKAVTTDGDLVYSSSDRLYVATSRWATFAPMPVDQRGAQPGRAQDEVRTQLHAFDVSSATTTSYVGSGSVDGYVYGRWALSEHEGVLRVATTRQPPWQQGDERETSSMVVKLAERGGRLVETGRVSGLGRTEHIKSVRYFADLAAVVTFRQTDPLYLIDLGKRPRVLGELKIPGFSTYLHPVGGGLLLGLGHDATDQGQVTGMQVSVFDISDASAPRQVDRLSLGPGWSPALDDSRAFSYDRDRRIAAFGVADHGPAIGGDGYAALGVHVGDDGTLTEAGRLPLAPEEGAARVLLDGSAVFAVAETGVVAGDAATWERTGAVSFGHSRSIERE